MNDSLYNALGDQGIAQPELASDHAAARVLQVITPALAAGFPTQARMTSWMTDVRHEMETRSLRSSGISPLREKSNHAGN